MDKIRKKPIKSPYNLTRNTMTKEVSLTHAERLELSKVLNSAKFTKLSDMAFALEDAKVIAHSVEEAKEINLQVINEGKSISWTEDSKEKTISLSETTITAVLEDIKAKEAAGSLTLDDKSLVTLQTKLK